MPYVRENLIFLMTWNAQFKVIKVIVYIGRHRNIHRAEISTLYAIANYYKLGNHRGLFLSAVSSGIQGPFRKIDRKSLQVCGVNTRFDVIGGVISAQ